MRAIPIAEVKRLAQSVGAEAVVVLAFATDQVAGTSYGATKAKCGITGKWMDGLIEEMTSGQRPAPEV